MAVEVRNREENSISACSILLFMVHTGLEVVGFEEKGSKCRWAASAPAWVQESCALRCPYSWLPAGRYVWLRASDQQVEKAGLDVSMKFQCSHYSK